MEVQLINEALTAELHDKAANNERLRMHFDLRTTPEDTSQRILNALQVGTHVPIHRHSETIETVICIEGCIDWILYEELPSAGEEGPAYEGDRALDESCFKEIARYRLCPREGKYGMQVPTGAWHSLEVYEPSTLLEVMDGKYIGK